MRWPEQQRMDFIGRWVTEHGTLRRADLINHFKISLPQASRDINKWLRDNPGRLEYDRSGKIYRTLAP